MVVLLRKKPVDSTAAVVAGWLYHIINGVTFGVMYALLAGPARWWFGLAWGAALELAILVIYPSSTTLHPPALAPFIIVSLTGHTLFGAVIGMFAQSHALPRPGMSHVFSFAIVITSWSRSTEEGGSWSTIGRHAHPKA